MSLLSKITAYVAPKAAEVVAKCTGKTYFVQNVYGMPIKTYVKTGKQVFKNADGQGATSIVLGPKNKLSGLLGEGTNILSYPKGSFFGGDTGMIVVQGVNAKKSLPMEPKMFGDFVKMLQAMSKAG